MDIVIDSLMEGAERAKGTAVIIDVFRAATTAACIMQRGAEEIVLAESFDDAFRRKNDDSSCVLVGERHGLRVDGFDYGNSPYEVEGADFSGKRLS